jgi:exopolysaccharide production protein ExoQ
MQPNVVWWIVAGVAPPASIYAPMSLTLVLVLGAIASATSKNVREQLLSLSRPLLVSLAIFHAFALLSSVWAIQPWAALLKGVQLTSLAVVGLLIVAAAQTLAASTAATLGKVLVASLVFTGVVLLLEKFLGMPIAYTLRPWPLQEEAPLYFLNRASTVMVIFALPALWFVAHHYGRVRAIALLAGVSIVVFNLASHTAAVALVVSVLAAAIAIFAPRAVALIVAGTIVGTAFLAPVVPGHVLAHKELSVAIREFRPSVSHRLLIWDFVAERIDERPVFGWGLDSSRRLPGGRGQARADGAAYDEGELLPLHPHNAALQVRVELGLVGLILILVTVLVPIVSWKPDGEPSHAQAGSLGMIVAIFIIASASFGLWQSWWLATIWLASGLMIAVRRSIRTPQPGAS